MLWRVYCWNNIRLYFELLLKLAINSKKRCHITVPVKPMTTNAHKWIGKWRRISENRVVATIYWNTPTQNFNNVCVKTFHFRHYKQNFVTRARKEFYLFVVKPDILKTKPVESVIDLCSSVMRDAYAYAVIIFTVKMCLHEPMSTLWACSERYSNVANSDLFHFHFRRQVWTPKNMQACIISIAILFINFWIVPIVLSVRWIVWITIFFVPCLDYWSICSVCLNLP